MPQYRSRPDVVEAWQFGNVGAEEPRPDWVDEAFRADLISLDDVDGWCVRCIDDHEIATGLDDGDWLLKGDEGSITVLSNDVFTNAYEAMA